MPLKRCLGKRFLCGKIWRVFQHRSWFASFSGFFLFSCFFALSGFMLLFLLILRKSLLVCSKKCLYIRNFHDFYDFCFCS